ncbi:MAG: hypothetical protein WAM07_15155 [Halobacillus sp.]
MRINVLIFTIYIQKLDQEAREQSVQRSKAIGEKINQTKLKYTSL